MLHRIRRPWPPPSATSTPFLVPLFLLISILVSLMPPSSCHLDEYKECRKRPVPCGNSIIDVFYPFYENESTSNCSLPDFQFFCDPQTFTISIFVEDRRYYLADDHIDYDHHSLTLVDKSSVDESCPRSTPNFSLNPLFHNRSDPVVNVTFWECSNPIPQLLSFNFSCSNDDANSQHKYYYWPNSSIPGDVMGHEETCHQTRKVWMDKSAVERMIAGSISYEEALQMIFTWTWTLEAWQRCSDCIDSGGFCGSLDRSQVCFCEPHASCPAHREDKPRRKHPGAPISPPPDQRTKHIRPGIIIGGTCAGAVGLILLCLVGVFFYRRRKRARGSGGLLSQSASSFYPSSKMDTEMFSDQGPHTQIFRYVELHEATDGFSSANELGEGGFGTVYKGILADGRTVAIKRLHENNYRQVEQFMTEVSILSSLRHPNLVSLYGCTSRHSRELILVYEYVPNGTVADHIHGPRASGDGLPWPIRMNIAIETAAALSYLHSVSPQIIHRDVKTNNILLDNYFQVKVADFGLSRLFPLNATHVSTAPQGTPGYVDPEYHECYQLTDRSDVYSFGVVLVELISSKPAVDITRPRHEINLASLALCKIQSDQLDQLVDPKLWHQANDEVVWMVNQVAELAFRCLQEDSELRPTMREVADALKAIDGEACSRAKGATAHGGMNDDACLLQSTREKSRPQSPDTVTTKWSSKSTKTTPNSSG